MDIPHLNSEALHCIATELDAIHKRVRDDLGERDATYIRHLITLQRRLDSTGRSLLLVAREPLALVAGTGLLACAKILENMEIGHGVLHGQWDWMGDRAIHSSTWEWDAAWTAMSWKHTHNYQHHTFTNVIGKDRDLGYTALRILPEQPWHPGYLLQPLYAIVMGALFEWVIAVYDMELDAVIAGRKSWSAARPEVMAFANKAVRQVTKDYVMLPLLAGRSARRALLGALAANVIRNFWTQTIVYCGHFPDGACTFTIEQYERESRGARYVRQLTGSCNVDGGRAFHVMSGHLGFQIEHHLFPSLPNRRYPELAVHVRAVCERHGLPYSTGSLRRQYGSVLRKIVRLALPDVAVVRRTAQAILKGCLITVFSFSGSVRDESFK